jgi:hypothetical protein
MIINDIENICDHNNDQIIFTDKELNVYSQCANCEKTFKLTCNFDANRFHTNMKPTNYHKKIYNIAKLEDGSFLYEKKSIKVDK